MIVEFQVKSLVASEFSQFFKMSAMELQELGASVMTVDRKPGYPCRVSLEDAELGEKVLLLNYHHHKASSAYDASGPIFIREMAEDSTIDRNQVPKMLDHRLLSVRAYDNMGNMTAAEVVTGTNIKSVIEDLFSNTEHAYLQVHNAGPGCYNCQIDRI